MRWAITAVLAIAGFLAADILFEIDYEVAADVTLIVVALLVSAFGLLYGLRSRWRANRIGKVFAAKSAILPLVLLQGSASAWLSTEYPGRQHVRFAIYALGVVAYVPMLVSLWREQQRDRGETRNESTAE